MEKGLKFLLYMLTIVISIIISSNSVHAYVCTDGNSTTECVCGHTPNSFLGYGQIVIGPNTYSCNNIADGVCPEDFTNGTLSGNCSTCADADCSVGGVGTDIDGDGTANNVDPDVDGDGLPNGSDPDIDGDGTANGADPTPNGDSPTTVSGIVRDKSGNPIDKVIIIAHPLKWNASANLDSNTTTNAAGVFSSDDFITGTYYISAQKDGYDTQWVEVTVVRGQNLSVNFTLQDGICHEDCTNSYNKCNAACDGVTFGNGTAKCQFFNNEVKLLCNNWDKGTIVKLSTGGNATFASFVNCCEGTPYLKMYSKADVSSTKCANLINTEKIARLNGVIVRVEISYCGQQK